MGLVQFSRPAGSPKIRLLNRAFGNILSIFPWKNSKTQSSLNFLQSGPRKFTKSDFSGLAPIRRVLKSLEFYLVTSVALSYSVGQEWPRQTKPKKDQFMNFSQAHSGTKVQSLNRACFPKEKGTRIHKNGRNCRADS